MSLVNRMNNIPTIGNYFWMWGCTRPVPNFPVFSCSFPPFLDDERGVCSDVNHNKQIFQVIKLTW